MKGCTAGPARFNRWLTILALPLALCVAGSVARAQVARVASVERTVEKRGRAAPWRGVGAGAGLSVGEGLRTGKRSKVDLKFADGSLLRIGQLSSLEIQSAKGARLTGGQVLFAQLKPGRVVAGSGAAEIKGSVGIITLGDDGSADFSLFSGSMDVVSGDRTVSLPVGRAVTLSAGGAFSAIRVATPIGFFNGELNPDITQEPQAGPSVSAPFNQRERESSGRAVADQILTQSLPAQMSVAPFGPAPSVSPFPTPFPTLGPGEARFRPPSSQVLGARSNSRNALQSQLQPPYSGISPQTAPPFIVHFGQPARLGPAMPVAPASTSTVSTDAAETTEAASVSATDAGTDVGANESLDVTQNATDFDLSTRAALDHIEQVARGRGQGAGGEASLIGAISDGGSGVYGARIRGFVTRGKLYAQGTLLPLRIREGGPGGGSRDYSSVADAFLMYRDGRGQVQAGRQRFVSGPTQASLFGSMIRSGGRETMDAIRVAPRLRGGAQIEAAYIYDAFPRNLPFQGAQIAGAQHALYGRAALRRPGFSVGLNALRYSSSPVESTTGVTADFAVPLMRKQIELYGELGRDPFRRTLTTFGLSFPGLYQKTNFDAYLEYARLRAHNGSAGKGVAAPPHEITLRVYRRVGANLNGVAALSRFGGGVGWNFTLGLSIGARTGAGSQGGIGQ